MFETYFVRKSSGAKILIFSHSPKKVRKSAAKVTKKYLQTKYLYFFYCDTFFLQYILHKRTTLFCGILNIYYFCTQHHALFLESAEFFVPLRSRNKLKFIYETENFTFHFISAVNPDGKCPNID